MFFLFSFDVFLCDEIFSKEASAVSTDVQLPFANFAALLLEALPSKPPILGTALVGTDLPNLTFRIISLRMKALPNGIS